MKWSHQSLFCQRKTLAAKGYGLVALFCYFLFLLGKEKKGGGRPKNPNERWVPQEWGWYDNNLGDSYSYDNNLG